MFNKNRQLVLLQKLLKLFRNEEGAVLLLSLFFLAGFFFHNWSYTDQIVVRLTDIFLFISNALVFWFLFRKKYSPQLLAWSIAAFAITFTIEYIGVSGGKIFGSYYYGETMKWQLGNVPVIIGVNWTVLILATYSMAYKWTKSIWISPVLSSVLIVVFDMIMEPVAMHLDYWQWEYNLIPNRNYFAWFIISLIFAGFLSVFRINPDSKILRAFFFIQIVFFLLFRLFSL